MSLGGSRRRRAAVVGRVGRTVALMFACAARPPGPLLAAPAPRPVPPSKLEDEPPFQSAAGLGGGSARGRAVDRAADREATSRERETIVSSGLREGAAAGARSRPGGRKGPGRGRRAAASAVIMMAHDRESRDGQ